MSGAELIVLGSGTAVPDADRGPTQLLWRGAAGIWLIDGGGEGFRRLLQAGIDPLDLDGIIITHSHLDHIGGLPALLFALSLAGRRQMLPLIGPPSALDDVRSLFAGAGLGEHCPPLEWRPVVPGEAFEPQPGVTVRTARTAHSRPCLALRVAQFGENWCYSADSGPSVDVEALASGCELLIHEAAVAQPEANHSTPADVGALATRLAVRRLVLVHFSPRLTMPSAQALADVRRAGYQGVAEIAVDGLRLALADGLTAAG